MTLRVYVAGSSAELPRAKEAIAACGARGWEVTLDWPALVEKHGGRANRGLSHDERSVAANLTLNAVCRADVFWLLVPSIDAPSRGCWVELGTALHVADVAMVVCSGDTEQSVFCVNLIEKKTDAQALAVIDENAGLIVRARESRERRR